MKSTEIRELAVNDLQERIVVEMANLAQMKINHSISPLEDTSKIQKSRRDIARMKTILSEIENPQK